MPQPNYMANFQSRVAQDEELHRRSTALAKRRGQSLGTLIRQALKEYLDLEEPRQAKLDEVRYERRRRVLKKIKDGPIDEFEN